jgi:solute carrier family 40 (iron-regulated transporter), member 1
VLRSAAPNPPTTAAAADAAANASSRPVDMADTSNGPPSPPLARSLTLQLYISHILSTWNSRLFEFGAVLFLAAVYPDTLLAVSLYAVARGVIAMILAQTIGNWIDRRGRLIVIRASIVGQRFAVIASCFAFWFMDRQSTTMAPGLKNGLFSVIVILACVEKVCSVMNLVSIERDWVVVITEGSEPFRRIMNARMRRIDLLCKLLGPLTISLIAIASTAIAIWATLAMNVVSVTVEFFAIQNVHRKVLALNERNHEEGDRYSETSARMPFLLDWLERTVKTILPLQSTSYYFKHPAFIPSFSLSLLHLTVLSFSGQMITYLISVGYSSLYVGLARAVSTTFELSATWVTPRVIKSIGTVRGGMWSLSWQMFWLAGGTAWFFAELEKNGPNSFVPVTGLAVGIVLSRVGLWGYDLCAQNIIQDVGRGLRWRLHLEC